MSYYEYDKKHEDYFWFKCKKVYFDHCKKHDDHKKYYDYDHDKKFDYDYDKKHDYDKYYFKCFDPCKKHY